MDIIHGTPSSSQFGGTTTIYYSYPSMSNKFTKIIFNRRIRQNKILVMGDFDQENLN